jgi:hypothetical protein
MKLNYPKKQMNHLNLKSLKNPMFHLNLMYLNYPKKQMNHLSLTYLKNLKYHLNLNFLKNLMKMN